MYTDLGPPIDVMPSLGRLMNAGIGEQNREDQRPVADQLYAALARGRALRRLTSIIGEAALSDDDRRYLTFAADLEHVFVNQEDERRTIEERLGLAWKLLQQLPEGDLNRIGPKLVDRYAGALTARADRRETVPRRCGIDVSRRSRGLHRIRLAAQRNRS